MSFKGFAESFIDSQDRDRVLRPVSKKMDPSTKKPVFYCKIYFRQANGTLVFYGFADAPCSLFTNDLKDPIAKRGYVLEATIIEHRRKKEEREREREQQDDAA